MKAFLLYFFFALLALSVQGALLKGIKPDFIFILVFFYSLRYGQLKGLAYGAVTGLLIDFVSGFILGPNIISKAFTGYAIASTRQKIFQWNIVINTVMIAIFSIIDIFIIRICLEIFANMSFVNMSMKTFIVQGVYTILISLVFFPLLNPEKNSVLPFKMR